MVSVQGDADSPRTYHGAYLQGQKDSLAGTKNKAGYTAIPVTCGWAGAVIELTKAFGQEL